MPDFRFRAVNAAGKIVRGQLPAEHEAHLAQQLLAQGYELLACRLRRQSLRLQRRAPDKKQLVLLFTQLAALAEAGVPLAVCLADTVPTLPPGILRDALSAVQQAVRQGTPLAEACATQPHVFPRSLIAVLTAGMAGGDLAHGFAKARDHVQWQAEFGALLRRATRYPLFLLTLCSAVTGFMLLYVVPQLVEFLQAQNYALPWHSRALTWFAAQFGAFWWLPFLFFAAGLPLALALRQTSPGFALWLDRLTLQLPFFGRLLRQRELALFLHHLALLIGGGVPILEALAAARGALGNHAMRQETETMLARLTAGEDLAVVWQDIPGLSGIVARRAQIGLQTGTLAHQLEQASAACDAATIAESKQLIGALEPALTLFVGALLAWIVLAVLGPLYGALGSLTLAH